MSTLLPCPSSPAHVSERYGHYVAVGAEVRDLLTNPASIARAGGADVASPSPPGTEDKNGHGPVASVNLATENEWEVVNDDGFVYRRQKSKHNAPPPILINTTTYNDDPYFKQRRLLKRACLLNLKSRYAREIREWESLSQMSQTTVTSVIKSIINPISSSPSLPRTQMQNARKYIFRELLQQAEAQETFIQDVTSLCNAAELMCEAHEQDLKRSALDFPIWENPTTLMHSLCPSDSEDTG